MTPLTSAAEYPEVIHGTYLKSWKKIEKKGLNRMSRNHIHFAIGRPGSKEVVSGMRSSAEIYIYLNMEKALHGKAYHDLIFQDGMLFQSLESSKCYREVCNSSDSFPSILRSTEVLLV